MKNRNRLIRKITSLLGIGFMMLGVVPVSVLSQAGSVYAAEQEDGAAVIVLPTFTSYSGLLESTSEEDPPVVEIPDEAPAEEPPAEEPPAEEPPAEEPVQEPPAEEPPAEEPPAEEPVQEPPAEEAVEEPATEVIEESLAEVVEILHEEEVVLVDAEGEEIPLVSVEAAEVLSLPDPMYCPPGEVYGGPTCSPAQLTMAAAIADAAGNGGTIFVESGDFTGFTLTGFDGYDLVIEGGAGGGTTIFNSQIYLHHNDASIILRNFTAHGTDAGTAISGDPSNTPTILALSNSGTITLEQLIVDHPNDTAIYIDDHEGGVLLDGVDASNSGVDGAYIDNTAGEKNNVIVMNSTFNKNKDTGLRVISNGRIGLDNVIANDNENVGAYLETSGPEVTVLNSNFNNNPTEYECPAEEILSGGKCYEDKGIADIGCPSGQYTGHPDPKKCYKREKACWWCWWRVWRYKGSAESCDVGEILSGGKCYEDKGGADIVGYSQNIGLEINNTGDAFETTVCNVDAKDNEDKQIKLTAPTGGVGSNFVYNLCDVDAGDSCGYEIFFFGGDEWTETTTIEPTCFNGGSPDDTCGWVGFLDWGCRNGCWQSSWVGNIWKGNVTTEITEDKSNVTVNTWDVTGDIFSDTLLNLIPCTGDGKQSKCCGCWCGCDDDGECLLCEEVCELPLDCGDGLVTGDEECDGGPNCADDCTWPPAGTCPTECGLGASQVPNGEGGFNDCAATEPCPVTPLVVPFSGIIPVIGGQLVELPCDRECVTLELPDGSQAEFCGLCGHWVSLSEEYEETILLDMPDGASMLMGMTVVLMDPDQVVLDYLPAGATLKLGYPLAEGVDPTAMTMYLYDPVKEEWVELTEEEVLDYLEGYADWPGISILVE